MGDKWSLISGERSVTLPCGCPQARLDAACGTIDSPRRFDRPLHGELGRMTINRSLKALVLGCALRGHRRMPTAPPPPMVGPASFTPLGRNRPLSDGRRDRRQQSARGEDEGSEDPPAQPGRSRRLHGRSRCRARRQTAGIGLDILQVGGGIVIRIPAIFTFDAGSAAVKPTTDATLLEIARTVKTRNRTFVDVLAHTDTTGRRRATRTLSDSRAAAVASYLAAHGVGKARMASKGWARARRSTIPRQ